MQSRVMSLIEAGANVAVGFGVAVAVQVVVFPWFGLHADMGEHLLIGAAFTVVSIVRSYALRRLFNAYGVWLWQRQREDPARCAMRRRKRARLSIGRARPRG